MINISRINEWKTFKLFNLTINCIYNSELGWKEGVPNLDFRWNRNYNNREENILVKNGIMELYFLHQNYVL